MNISKDNYEEQFSKFDTGAIRSSDANSVALWLFSPIAMERLAKFCRFYPRNETEQLPFIYVERALETIFSYLSGDTKDTLEVSTINVFLAIKFQPYVSGYKNGYSNIPIEGIMAVGRAYKEGLIKYCDYNCELGFPIWDLLNHCLLHLYKYLQNDTTEDQLGHAGWNLVMAMHSEVMWPDLNKATLRGPNCTLTDDIRQRIDETMKAKKNEK